jgi:signal transduction histidine kinase
LITGSSNELTVIFVDTGIGIPPEDLHNIFEPFYRANNTQNVKGHGIGLSMVKRILTLHHSTIEINSAQGSGTTITVTFPQVHNAFVNF